MEQNDAEENACYEADNLFAAILLGEVGRDPADWHEKR
jgi:hypothetical protein